MTAGWGRLGVAAVVAVARSSRATVAMAGGRALELTVGEWAAALAKVRWIGMDGVGRACGRTCWTSGTNPGSRRVRGLGDGKGRRGLLPFLRGLDFRGRRKLGCAVSGPGDQAILPWARIVP